jgi:hypothetical protein
MKSVNDQVTVLPSEDPSPQLTVRTVSKTLGEHFTAFLAANNLNGYLDDPDYVLRDDRVGDILLRIVERPGMSIKDMKKRARSMHNKFGLKHTDGLHVLSRALGYPAWDMANKYRDANDFVINMWLNRDTKVREHLFATGEKFTKQETRVLFKPGKIANALKHNLKE